MGSFAGHIIPSVAFAVWGVAWLTQSFWLYLTIKYGTRRATHSDAVLQQKSHIPSFCGCPRFPVEPLIKIVLATLGVFMEMFFMSTHDGRSYVFDVWRPRDEHGEFSRSGLPKLQHITIHSGFILSGFIDVLAVYVRLPKQIPKIFLTMALLSLSFIMYYHPRGRLPLDLLAHNLYAYVAIATFIFSGLRMLSASDLWINTGFSLSLILQATWLTQVGWVRYGPTQWNLEYPPNQLFLVSCFVWHIMIILVCALIYYIVLLVCARRVYGRLSLRLSTDETAERDQLLKIEKNAFELTSLN